MKKYVIKATALAIGALVGGSAFATITLSDSTADARTYATELVASGDSVTDTNVNVVSKFGFGVSSGATRYLRFDLTNAKWATAVTSARLDAGTLASSGTSYTPSVSVVAGGTTSDTYVIFQVTADANYDQGDAFSLALATIGVKVTSVASPVSLAYTMYETAGQAVNNDTSVKLAGYSETIAKFSKALSFVVTPGTQVASVEKSFKEFTTSGTNSAPAAKIAKLGKVDNTVATAYTAAGVAVANSDLIAAGTKIVVTGDFAAKGKVYLDNATTDCSTESTVGTFATGNTTTASITTGAAAVSGYVCYSVTGDTAVPEQTTTVVYDVTAAGSSTTADTASTTLGTIQHDGTTLQAPFATIHADYLSRVVLTSTYSVDAAVTASVITETGVTCSAVNGSYTLKAGKQLIINTKDICPSLTDASGKAVTRLAVKLDVVAPSTSISGVYNVMNFNQTTGATDSLISYPLLRPGTN